MPRIKAFVLPGYWEVQYPDKSSYGSFVYVENDTQYIGVCFRSWVEPREIKSPSDVIMNFSKVGAKDVWNNVDDDYVEKTTDNKFKPWLQKAEVMFLTGAWK